MAVQESKKASWPGEAASSLAALIHHIDPGFLLQAPKGKTKTRITRPVCARTLGSAPAPVSSPPGHLGKKVSTESNETEASVTKSSLSPRVRPVSSVVVLFSEIYHVRT